MSVLGIDVGTSTCKGLVISADGKTLAKRQRAYNTKPTIEKDVAEISALVFRDGVFSIIKECAEEVRDKDAIEAIALSTHGETLILVDKNNEAITPAILSMDRRGIKATEILEKEIGKEGFYEICGTPIHSQYPIPKIMWFKENDKGLVDRTFKFCTMQDYIHAQLGVDYCVDYSLASRFGGFDIKERRWSKKIFSLAGVEENMFSRAVPSGTVIGEIPPSIASKLGLSNGVKVVAGGHDQPCAALGMGIADDKVTVSAGSYECASIMTDKPLNDEKGFKYGLNSYCHVVEDKYVTLAFFTSGLMVSWFVDKFCPFKSDLASGNNVFSYLEGIAPKSPTGICFTPHIYGSMNPKWDDKARAKISGLTGECGLGHLYRAVLEGTSCELDLNMKVLEELSGGEKQAVFCGGGAKSDLWMQIRSDITDKKIKRIDGELDVSCIGAAIIAGVGNGTFIDHRQAVDLIKYSYSEFTPQNADGYKIQKQNYKILCE